MRRARLAQGARPPPLRSGPSGAPPARGAFSFFAPAGGKLGFLKNLVLGVLPWLSVPCQVSFLPWFQLGLLVVRRFSAVRPGPFPGWSPGAGFLPGGRPALLPGHGPVGFLRLAGALSFAGRPSRPPAGWSRCPWFRRGWAVPSLPFWAVAAGLRVLAARGPVVAVGAPSGFLARAFALACGLSPARARRGPRGWFVVVPARALASARPRCAFCALLGRCSRAGSPGVGCGFRPFFRPVSRQRSLF